MDKAQKEQFIRAHLQESAKVKALAADCCHQDIAAAAELIAAAFKKGCKLMICGNGGSAADAQHFAAEFVSRLSGDFVRPGLPAIALTTDTSFLTAYTNDYNFEGVFARQVEALGRPGDVLMGISTSGNSRNVIKAFESAKSLGISTLALCGEGGSMPQMATMSIRVPNGNTQHVQESHLAIEHLICALVERELYPDQKKA